MSRSYSQSQLETGFFPPFRGTCNQESLALIGWAIRTAVEVSCDPTRLGKEENPWCMVPGE